jgi:hypothetical protein
MGKKITFVFCVALTLAFGFSFIAEASVDSVYEVAVVDLKGDVQVDVDGTGKMMIPWIGMKLRKKSIITTGEDSNIDVAFDADGLNVLRIKENTKTAIKLASVELSDGSVLANFANLTAGSTFNVKTPTAVCGIRGSGMEVDFINYMTVVSAFEHSVYVQGVDSNGDPVGVEVTVPQGWKTQVLVNGNINPSAELSENEKLIFNAWVKAVTGGAFGTGDDFEDAQDQLKDDIDTKDLQDKKEISPSE